MKQGILQNSRKTPNITSILNKFKSFIKEKPFKKDGPIKLIKRIKIITTEQKEGKARKTN